MIKSFLVEYKGSDECFNVTIEDDKEFGIFEDVDVRDMTDWLQESIKNHLGEAVKVTPTTESTSNAGEKEYGVYFEGDESVGIYGFNCLLKVTDDGELDDTFWKDFLSFDGEYEVMTKQEEDERDEAEMDRSQDETNKETNYVSEEEIEKAMEDPMYDTKVKDMLRNPKKFKGRD